MIRFSRSVFFLIFIFFYSCDTKEPSFSFFPVNQSDLDHVQSQYFHPPSFRIFQDPITFEENKIIWFAYRPNEINRELPYALSLSRKSLGWVELDLRAHRLETNTEYITNYYKDLEPGEYLLTVALKNKKLGSVIFHIIPERGEEIIDYDAPLAEADSVDTPSDDILYFSQ